jgi:hypothetical protein
MKRFNRTQCRFPLALAVAGCIWFAAALFAAPNMNACQTPSANDRTVPPIGAAIAPANDSPTECPPDRPSHLAAAAAGDITGKWKSNWGPMEIRCGKLNDDGVYPVTGSWVQGPRMFGEIVSGTFDPKSGLFRFRFDEPWHDQKGSAELQRAKDGSFSGTWTFDSGGGPGLWTMMQD